MTDQQAPWLRWLGGRKFLAFLIVTALVWRFVEMEYLTDQTIIRDLLVALLAVFGVVNVGQKAIPWVQSRLSVKPEATAPPQQ